MCKGSQLMKLYFHFKEITLIIHWDDSNRDSLISDLKKHFAEVLVSRHHQTVNQDDIVLANENDHVFPSSEKVATVLRHGDDVYVYERDFLKSKPKAPMRRKSPQIAVTTSHSVKAPVLKTSSPTQATSSPSSPPSNSDTFTPSVKSEASKYYDSSEIDDDSDDEDESIPPLQKLRDRGLEKLKQCESLDPDEKLNGTCSVCGEMLTWLRKENKVPCYYCKTRNLPVVFVDAQAECSLCRRPVFRIKGERAMKCATCGSRLAVIQCKGCKTPFVAPDGLSAMPCPSCGTLLSHQNSIKSHRLPFNLLVNEDVNEPEEWFQREAKPRERNRDIKINLVVQYYRDSSEQRQAELDECIRKNISNRYIDNIWMFLETDFDVQSYFNSEKIKKCQVLGRRLKFGEAIEYCNENLKGQLCILSNLDIYFDHTLRELIRTFMDGKFLCLSRHDVTAQGTIQFNEWVSPISQDSWMFKAPLVKPLASYEMNIDFALGYPGCDNRIAHEFKRAGFHVLNPCLKIICRHLHISQKRNYTQENRIEGQYAACTPSADM